MRIIELTNNLTIPLSNEEIDLLDKFNNLTEISKSSLSQREQFLANQLVTKDVLIRKNNGQQITYKKKIRNH